MHGDCRQGRPARIAGKAVSSNGRPKSSSFLIFDRVCRGQYHPRAASFRKGSMECPAKDLGISSKRLAATEAHAQSRMSRYISLPAMLPYQWTFVSEAMTTTFGTSQGPRHPLIVSCSCLSRPRRRHSAFSHSVGTSGRPRSTAPQQHPWQTST